ncbi:hypothetical protein ACHAW6_005605 [Cyclotella cf. meneghiniana]
MEDISSSFTRQAVKSYTIEKSSSKGGGTHTLAWDDENIICPTFTNLNDLYKVPENSHANSAF